MSNQATNKPLAFETRQLHSGQEQADPASRARAVPIYQTTSFVFENTSQAEAIFRMEEQGYTYTRTGNPTSDVLEQRVASLEGGTEALALASGAAATFYSILNIARAGDHIVSSSSVYGGTYNLFKNLHNQYGIQVSFVPANQLQEYEQAITPRTKAIFAETLGNPHSDIVDVEALALLAHKHGIPLIVDNTLASPYLLRPIEYGADIVVHSATKFIGGHGTTIGGIIVDGGHFDWKSNDKFPGLSQPDPAYHGVVFADTFGNEAAYIKKIRNTLLRDTGAVISPFNSFLLLQGIETLSLRVERHVHNSLAIVRYLSAHPKVKRVNHPSVAGGVQGQLYHKYFPQGAGSIFTFEIDGNLQQTKRFVDALQLFSLLVNIADSKSLVTHPASTTHSQMSSAEKASIHIFDNTVRLSIGTEWVDDLIQDLDQAFAQL